MTYATLVDKWGDRALLAGLVSCTLRYCRVMLASPRLKSAASERTLLKNLGSWLGRLTLARNKPVLQASSLPPPAACPVLVPGLWALAWARAWALDCPPDVEPPARST